MAHDASKVVMGTTQSSSKQGSEDFAADPATFPAGVAVRRNSSNGLSVTLADGGWVGISMGRSVSDTKKTTVLRAGERVPILLTAGFTPVIGAKAYISDVTGMAAASDDAGGVTLSDAVYVSGVMTGLAEDGTDVDVALVDMPGGL